MKKIISMLLILLIYMLPAFSQNETPFVFLNGEPLVFKEEIYIKKGRTMIEAKTILEAFKLNRKIDPENQVFYASKEGLSIGLSLSQNKGYINEGLILLDVSAEIKNDKIYLPLRFVAEALGADVIWQEKQGQVHIDWSPYKAWSISDLLEIIKTESQLETVDYGLQRERYHEIIEMVNQLKLTYEKNENLLKKELISLGQSKDLVLKGDSLLLLMKDFHQHLMLSHDQSSKSDAWVMADGYYHLSYDLGYYYGYYENYQAEGFKFGYTPFGEGYVLSFVPYEKNKRNGIGYKVVFNSDHSIRYDMFYKMKNNLNTSLDYVRYNSGIETFDKGNILGDSVVRIEENNAWFIPPLDGNNKSHVYNDGMGYYRFADGVEYVGFFQAWHFLGQGMYYGIEDGYLSETNLVDQISQEILSEIINEPMTKEEKVKSVHDYLSQHIRYDFTEPPNALSHTAYGALVLGQGVCDGYAGSFKYLLDLLDIENVLIFGTSKGIHHAWNLIEINGVYSHYDLTWNDDDYGLEPVYTYYNKTSDFFNESHQWDEEKYQRYLPKQ